MSAKPLCLGVLSTKDVNVSETIVSRSVVHPESKKYTLPSPRLGARSKELFCVRKNSKKKNESTNSLF
jgi:hypothetical protein